MIVLLDLNLLGTDGREVLKEIPIIVMTTSAEKHEIERCCHFGANSYIMKPITFQGYLEAVQKLKDYWFKIVLLPGIRD